MYGILIGSIMWWYGFTTYDKQFFDLVNNKRGFLFSKDPLSQPKVHWQKFIRKQCGAHSVTVWCNTTWRTLLLWICRFILWYDYFTEGIPTKWRNKADKLIRRRILQLLWKQWKKPDNRSKQLMNIGTNNPPLREFAYSSNWYWRIVKASLLHRVLSKKKFVKLGRYDLEAVDMYTSFVWEADPHVRCCEMCGALYPSTRLLIHHLSSVIYHLRLIVKKMPDFVASK